MRLVIDLQGAQGSNHARGIGRYSRELALAMARDARNHEVIVALNGTLLDTAEVLRAQFGDVLPASQVRVWHAPAGTSAVSGSPLRAGAEEVRAQFLASLKPDLVHVTSLFEGLTDDALPLLPQGAPRLPVVATCYDLIPLIRQGDYLDPIKSHPQMAPWYYRSLQQMFLCEGLLAISESSREEAIRYLPYAPERVFNIQAGISEAFRPAPLNPAEHAALLRRYGLRGSYVLFLGAGDPRKNEAGLLAAYSRLPQALQKQYQLLIVGRIDEDRLRASASSAGVPQSSIIVAPFVREEDLNPLYSTCSLFVFPSLHEGFGLPLAEAMACGAPCIASNTTSLPEVMGRQDATFDPSDPDAIAARMREVLENAEFRAELAAFGPAQAGRFTWSSSANRAWDALEAIDARLKAEAAPGATRFAIPKGPRPSMAFVATLPATTTSRW
jgi:glycosyltransferase involved in cell wall biosynthesis